MVLAIEPFRVSVINPARDAKDGGLENGKILTVRAMLVTESKDDKGNILVYLSFLVWNEALRKMMFEEAAQFQPTSLHE